MIRRHPLIRTCLITALAAAITFHSVSCGTMLYPERRGQPSGRLDLKVVALDGLFLLFFFVPGVIAFAVDFATGAIYLPPPGYGQAHPEQFDQTRWKRVEVDPATLDRCRIEQVVSQHAGRPIHLEPGTFEVRELNGARVHPVSERRVE